MQAFHVKINFVFIMRFKATLKWPNDEIIHNIGK